ncbi:MAG TPA: hypothetical protein VFO65_10945 [Acidimicrobiales bacterium]|nr:hypothetical protein [Acidimicrobiales bacterium]
MTEAFVVSDLHLGGGAADPLEDFEQDALFAAFVRSMARPGSTLIINGDFVDFAQLEPLTVEGVPSHLLWPEEASLAKLDTALAGHPDCFRALGELAAAGGEIRVVAGNHDLDFVWDGVQRRLREVLGNPDAAGLSFVIGATAYEGVHVEHGYSFTPENCPRRPTEFVHDGPGGRPYLERVWGTDFLLGFFNHLEKQHRYVDNVKPTIKLAWHALRRRWIPARAIVALAVAVKRAGIPWDAIPTVLDAGEASRAALLESFADPEWQQLALEVVSDPELGQEVEDAIRALPPEDRGVLLGGTPVEIGEPMEAQGAEVLGVFRNTTREERAARRALKQPGTTHVVYGHTHDIVDGGLERRWFNPGSWIPHLDLKDAEVRERVRAYGWSVELVSDHSLYRTNARAVRIVPGAGPGGPLVELVSLD